MQVQRWMGHHSPSFTFDRYVHLLDEDVPEPTFFDELEVGHVRATQAAEAHRNEETPEVAEVAV